MSTQPQSLQGDDLADLPQASYTPDIAAEIEAHDPDDTHQIRLLSQEIAVRMLAMLADAPNPSLRIWALAFATGLPLTEGKSETQVAQNLGVTRAAFSKEVRIVMRSYQITQNRNTKSAAACRKYKEITHEKHWRKQTAADAARTALAANPRSVSHDNRSRLRADTHVRPVG